MTDDPFDARFDALLRDAAHTYNRPPDADDTDALWAAIERALPAAEAERPTLTVVRGDARRFRVRAAPWLRTAAVLLVGVLLGRLSAGRTMPAATPITVARVDAPAAAPLPVPPVDVALPDQLATDDYLGRTEALLAALPAELRSRRVDPAYESRADALLLQTRLLQDSPAAADPAMRSLFDDLEVVLAQVVRLRADRDPTRLDFLRQALEQRDVLPRLRDAVADKAAAD